MSLGHLRVEADGDGWHFAAISYGKVRGAGGYVEFIDNRRWADHMAAVDRGSRC